MFCWPEDYIEMQCAEINRLRADLAALSQKNAKLWVAATKFLNEQTEENAKALSLALTDKDLSSSALTEKE